MRRIVAAALAAGVALVGWTGQSQQAGFEGAQTVRSVELLVALEAVGSLMRDRRPPDRPTSDDLRVRVDGVESAVASVDIAGDVASEGAWRVLVYVDRVLSSPELIRRAAAALGANAERLTERGAVEIVVADPVPRRLLAPTRDTALVDAALSGLLLRPEGADALTANRGRLRTLGDLSGPERNEAIRDLLFVEVDTVRRQQDRLLSWLTMPAEPVPGRVLFLVSGGFDLRPRSFYEGPGAEDGWLDERQIGADWTALTQTAAAFGWISVAVQAPEPDPLPRRWGLRRQLLMLLDRNWDPERAEAQLELGESLMRQEKWQRAEAALRESIYAFYDQPKRIERQAYAMSRLGYVLERQDRLLEAHRVYAKALDLDPWLVETIGPGVAALRDPLAPLAGLAEASSGGIVRNERQVGELLDGLARRHRVRLEIADGSETGLHRVEIEPRQGTFAVLAPGWVRSATPAAVSAARARRQLDEELEVAAGDLAVLAPVARRLACLSDEAPVGATVVAEIDPALPRAWEGAPLRYRFSVAVPTAGLPRVEHQVVEAGRWTPGDVWRHERPVTLDPERPWLSVVVEEMNTGRWFGSLLECEAG